ncbi:MAG: DUF2288 domain-containing protein [Granulosicoccaceae bacterium]
MSADDSAEQKSQEQDVQTKLNGETAVIDWGELVKHFARGVVIKINPSLDLLEAADGLASDNVSLFEQWVAAGKLSRASDDDARDWTAREPKFWCVVTAPWVLVQEKLPGSSQIN